MGIGDTLPPPGDAAAVIVDAQLLDGAVTESLVAWVKSGGSLLVMATKGAIATASSNSTSASMEELTGVRVDRALARGEWFATVVDAGRYIVRRAPGEFAVEGTFVPLEIVDDARELLRVSVGPVTFPVLVERFVGAGRVVTCGFDDLGSDVPAELKRVLARGLTRRADEPTTRAPIGVAIVGYGPFGGMGHAHGLAVEATEGLELVAVCEPVADRRAGAQAQFPGVRAYEKMADVLADRDVALAIVGTPPTSHVELALQAMREGRHAVVEKPLCFNVDEVDDLVATAAAHGTALTVHQNRRWDPDFRAVRRVVDHGELGEVFNVETFVGGFDHPCRAWHSEVTVSGGAAYDWGAHYIDWTLQLLGSAPARVTSMGHKRVWRDVTNLDQERIHLSWADGREAEFIHSDVAAVRRPKFYIQGTAGTLVGHYRPVDFERIDPGRGFVTEHAHHAEAPASLSLVSYKGNGALAESTIPLDHAPAFSFHRNLADHIADGMPLAVTVESVRPVIAVLEAATASSQAGGEAVRLPE